MTYYKAETHLESGDFPFHTSAVMILANEKVVPHAHEFVELAYIADGKGEHQYDGEWHRIATGDVFVIEPDQEHAYRVGSESHLLVYNVLFEPALLKAELEALSQVTSFIDFYYVEPFFRNTVRFQTHLRLLPDERIEVRAHIDRMMNEFAKRMPGYRIMLKTQLIELFIFLSRSYEYDHNTSIKHFTSDALVIEQICRFIRQHYAKPLTLSQVSRLCGMSQSAFSVKFKEHVGKTLIEYRNEVRIAIAQVRLEETEDKILKIAQDVGFDDLSFFNKLFKAITGMSPGQWRKK